MSQAGSFAKANPVVVTSIAVTSPLTSSGSTGAVTIGLSTPLAGQYGGTGVANTGLTINLSGGSTGKVLTSDSSGNGTWVALSSEGVTSITGTANQIAASSPTGAVTLSLIGPYTPATYTAHGVLLGQGNSSIVAVAPSATSGVALISQGAAADPAFGTVVVAGGGTGNTSQAAYSLVCGGTTTTGAFQAVSDVATGQVLVSGGTSALPAFSATPTVTSISFGNQAISAYVTNSWTPVLKFGGSATGITYTTQSGLYWQIGSLIYFSLQITLSSKGAQTGTATITGFPQTITSGDVGLYAVQAEFLTYIGNCVVGQLTSGSGMRLLLEKTASASTVLDNTAFANNTGLIINGVYSI
jgi:hypothetical protein